jgi:mannitol-1-phosphate 5-dehydrogenase
MKKEIIIYGAGKIGRGFVADVFYDAGYHLCLVDCSNQLVQALNDQGYYTLHHIPGEKEQEKKQITGFDAILSSDPSLPARIKAAGLMAVATFPDAFPDVAHTIAQVLKLKQKTSDQSPLDIIVLANVVGPKKLLKKALFDLLDESEQRYAEQVLSFLDTAVMRVVTSPTAEMLAEDPLTVLTDGHMDLPIENNFLGEKPQSPILSFHDAMDVIELRKLYTYNMAHAVTAYWGWVKGYETIAKALEDPEIETIVRGALAEVSEAFARKGLFAQEEMQKLSESIIKKYKNPLFKDSPVRVGADPIRKLARDNRLVGAALMVRSQGIYPYYLYKAIAGALHFSAEEDAAAKKVRHHIAMQGLDSAIRVFTGLHEADMIYCIKQHYLHSDGRLVPSDTRRVAFLKQAYENGFKAEITYKGCAQCVLIAMGKLLDRFDRNLFRAATGFSGGMALCGDGVCGGYSGGTLFTGLLKGRDFDAMLEHGDKENQYIAYDCAQALHDHFVACYGSPICARIHEGMFNGEHFILREKERRTQFEAAGAHTVVCTSVVALACAWIAEIVLDQGLYTLNQ